MLIRFFLMIIIFTSLTVRGQPSPRFYVEAWLPFRNCEMDYCDRVVNCEIEWWRTLTELRSNLRSFKDVHASWRKSMQIVGQTKGKFECKLQICIYKRCVRPRLLISLKGFKAFWKCLASYGFFQKNSVHAKTKRYSKCRYVSLLLILSCVLLIYKFWF